MKVPLQIGDIINALNLKITGSGRSRYLKSQHETVPKEENRGDRGHFRDFLNALG